MKQLCTMGVILMMCNSSGWGQTDESNLDEDEAAYVEENPAADLTCLPIAMPEPPTEPSPPPNIPTPMLEPESLRQNALMLADQRTQALRLRPLKTFGRLYLC